MTSAQSPADGRSLSLRELSLRAWRNNRRRAERLTTLVSELGDGGEPTTARRELALSLSHDLVGSAGTFGHAKVSETARRMETMFARMPDLSADDLAELAGLCDRIQASLAEEPGVED